MKDTHNKQQAERINRAWAFVLYWAQRRTNLKNEIEDAMRADKKLRSTFPTTRALFMRDALNIHDNNPTVQELYSRNEDSTLVLGACLVWRAMKLCHNWGETADFEELIVLMRGAVAAHDLAIEERLQTQ